MAESPGVVVNRPTVSKLLTVEPVSALTITEQAISVPYAMLDSVRFYLPPGVNYSVGVGLAFSGRQIVPTIDQDDFIFGPGVAHDYPVGVPVQNEVVIRFRQFNNFTHNVYVALYMDYRPVQNVPSMVGPRAPR